jgi:hypothetical protein
MLTPAPGSVLPGATATFTWNNVGATNALFFGTSVGAYNIFNTGWLAAGTTSYTFTKAPVNGSIVYVRLMTNFGGTVMTNDYTYTAYTMAGSVMLTPAPGSVLPGATATFTWNNVGATNALFFGTSVGGYNIFNTGWLPAGTTSYTFTKAPVNGSIVYVRLMTNFGGTVMTNDYVYTAYTMAGSVMLTPINGSILTGTTATFTWNNVGGVNALFFGTSVGAYNIFNTGWLPAGTTSYTFTKAPVNGSIVYVRLMTNFGGTVMTNDYTYTSR